MVKKKLILGLGNPLVGDEGIGCEVAARLVDEKFPEDVEVLDGGTGGIAILHMLEGREEVLVIDCADFGGEPGEIREFDPNKIVGLKDHPLSLHHLDLKGVLDVGEKIGINPSVKIIGIQPKVVTFKRELTKEVEGAIDKVIQMVKQIFS